ncbi:MAG: tautomerase family protein [Proteobacteria bacterium]|nr:tautomerase family protein [Pseudomonadota bacterium]
MPEVIVHALSGRTPEQKRRLMKAITEAVAEHFEVPAAGIVVQIVESPADSKSKGGVPYSDIFKALPSRG